MTIKLLCALFRLAVSVVCVIWGKETASPLHFSQQKWKGLHFCTVSTEVSTPLKYSMGLVHFTSISQMLVTSRLSHFALGEEENYSWPWKQREKSRNDGQTVVSVWDGEQRKWDGQQSETSFPSAWTIARAPKKHLRVRSRGRKRISSAQISGFAYGNFEEVPTGRESCFYFASGFCVLWAVPACYVEFVLGNATTTQKICCPVVSSVWFSNQSDSLP